MASSKLESAQKLANFHFEVEPRLTKVFLLGPVSDEDPREPIKLLEVVEGAIERGIEPVSFASDEANGIDFTSTIVELSPREFSNIDPHHIPFRGRIWSVEKELLAHG